MPRLLKLLSFLLLAATAFGQGGVIGASGVIGNSGVIGATPPTPPAVIQTARCDTVATNTCTATFGQAVGVGSYLGCYNLSDGNSGQIACAMSGETFTHLT